MVFVSIIKNMKPPDWFELPEMNLPQLNIPKIDPILAILIIFAILLFFNKAYKGFLLVALITALYFSAPSIIREFRLTFRTISFESKPLLFGHFLQFNGYFLAAGIIIGLIPFVLLKTEKFSKITIASTIGIASVIYVFAQIELLLYSITGNYGQVNFLLLELVACLFLSILLIYYQKNSKSTDPNSLKLDTLSINKQWDYYVVRLTISIVSHILLTAIFVNFDVAFCISICLFFIFIIASDGTSRQKIREWLSQIKVVKIRMQQTIQAAKTIHSPIVSSANKRNRRNTLEIVDVSYTTASSNRSSTVSSSKSTPKLIAEHSNTAGNPKIESKRRSNFYDDYGEMINAFNSEKSSSSKNVETPPFPVSNSQDCYEMPVQFDDYTSIKQKIQKETAIDLENTKKMLVLESSEPKEEENESDNNMVILAEPPSSENQTQSDLSHMHLKFELNFEPDYEVYNNLRSTHQRSEAFQYIISQIIWSIREELTLNDLNFFISNEDPVKIIESIPDLLQVNGLDTYPSLHEDINRIRSAITMVTEYHFIDDNLLERLVQTGLNMRKEIHNIIELYFELMQGNEKNGNEQDGNEPGANDSDHSDHENESDHSDHSNHPKQVKPAKHENHTKSTTSNPSETSKAKAVNATNTPSATNTKSVTNATRAKNTPNKDEEPPLCIDLMDPMEVLKLLLANITEKPKDEPQNDRK